MKKIAIFSLFCIIFSASLFIACEKADYTSEQEAKSLQEVSEVNNDITASSRNAPYPCAATVEFDIAGWVEPEAALYYPKFPTGHYWPVQVGTGGVGINGAPLNGIPPGHYKIPITIAGGTKNPKMFITNWFFWQTGQTLDPYSCGIGGAALVLFHIQKLKSIMTTIPKILFLSMRLQMKMVFYLCLGLY
jgi:hypothetical protein